MSFVEKDLNGNEAKERLPLEKLRAQAIFELQETPELTEKCLAALKVALKRDKALTYLDDDEFLVQFLRARKYKVDRAAIMVQKFFRLRANQIDLLNLIVPSEKTTFFKTGAVSILKHRDNFGRHVVLVRACKSVVKLKHMKLYNNIIPPRVIILIKTLVLKCKFCFVKYLLIINTIVSEIFHEF